MNIKDIGIIIGHKALKETTSIITVLTKHHGLYSGIISRKSKQKTNIYQAGNLVDFFWQARLHEDIGLAKCELIRAYSSFVITDKSKLYALNSIISLIKRLFHERQAHVTFFEKLELYIKNLTNGFDFKQYIDMELEMLTELGYGLELTNCAKTGSHHDLYYVSPKSGRAVSKDAGEAYKDKLLLLPQFLLNRSSGLVQNSNRLLPKLAPEDQVSGALDTDNCSVLNASEDLSLNVTPQSPSKQEFRKKSNIEGDSPLTSAPQLSSTLNAINFSKSLIPSASSVSANLEEKSSQGDLPNYTQQQSFALEQKKQAIELTSYFLNRYLFHDQEQPQARINFINYILSVMDDSI